MRRPNESGVATLAPRFGNKVDYACWYMLGKHVIASHPVKGICDSMGEYVKRNLSHHGFLQTVSSEVLHSFTVEN